MPPVAQTFQQVLQRLMKKERVSINALAKRFSELHGGSRDDNRKQIRRHLGTSGRTVEPGEAMIQKYAQAFGVDRGVFPPAVSARQSRVRALEPIRERLAKIAENEPHLREELAEIQAMLPDPPANPGRPTKRRPQRQ